MVSPLSDPEPQLHRRHLMAMPWPPTLLLHKPHSPLSGPEPQLQCRHLTAVPWPLTPLLHRPRYPPSRQPQLHLHCHPPHCRAPVTSHLVHQMVTWECHYPLGWCWQWWFLLDPTPSTTSLSCAPNADTAAGPQQPRPEGAAYPIPLPSARDAHPHTFADLTALRVSLPPIPYPIPSL